MKIISVVILAILGIVRPVFTQVSPDSVPIIDGIIGMEEWADAREEVLTDGGEVLLLPAETDLYIAVIGTGPGLASLCTGNFDYVEILHASAALGSVFYTRFEHHWQLNKPFEWHMRDVPELSQPLTVERESFFEEYQWLSNSSHRKASTREFRIKLGPKRQFLGIVFLSTHTMKAAYWPASMSRGCRNLELLLGDAPDSLQFEPSGWYRINFEF